MSCRFKKMWILQARRRTWGYLKVMFSLRWTILQQNMSEKRLGCSQTCVQRSVWKYVEDRFRLVLGWKSFFVFLFFFLELLRSDFVHLVETLKTILLHTSVLLWVIYCINGNSFIMLTQMLDKCKLTDESRRNILNSHTIEFVFCLFVFLLSPRIIIILLNVHHRWELGPFPS